MRMLPEEPWARAAAAAGAAAAACACCWRSRAGATARLIYHVAVQGPPHWAAQWAAAAAEHADRVAIVFDGARGEPAVTYTYRELDERAGRVVRQLACRGARRGDRVVTITENRPEQVVLLIACAQAGFVFVPLAEDLADADYDTLLRLYQPALVVLGPGTPAPQRGDGGSWAELCAALPAVPKGRAGRADGATAWDDVEREAPGAPARPPPPRASKAECGIIFSTSGSTGLPKGVMHSTHVIAMISGYVKLMQKAGLPLPESAKVGPGTCKLIWEPLRGVSAVYGVLGLLPYGAKILMVSAPAEANGPAVWADLIRKHSPDKMTLFGSAMNRLCTEVPGSVFPCMREIGYGGSCFPPSLVQQSMAMFPNAKFAQGYGMTEILGMAQLHPHLHWNAAQTALPGGGEDEEKLSIMSCAGVSVPMHDYFLEDPDGEGSARRVADGTEGQICVKGGTLMMGYYGMPDKTREAVPDGYMRTGDLGVRTRHVDPVTGQRLLRVTGRLKDVIPHHAGFNVAPRDVEAAIQRLPAVGEVAVVGVAHPTGAGEMVAAFVVAKPGEELTAAGLRAHCARERLRAQPELWCVSDHTRPLPVHGGKVAKKLLRSVAHVQENASMHIDDVVARLQDAQRGPVTPVGPVTPLGPDAAWAPRARAVFEALDVSNTGTVDKAELGALFGVRAGDESPTARRVGALMRALDADAPGHPGLDRRQWQRFVRKMEPEGRDTFLLKCQSIIASLQRRGDVRRLACEAPGGGGGGSAFD